jgi:hypothetical protein
MSETLQHKLKRGQEFVDSFLREVNRRFGSNFLAPEIQYTRQITEEEILRIKELTDSLSPIKIYMTHPSEAEKEAWQIEAQGLLKLLDPGTLGSCRSDGKIKVDQELPLGKLLKVLSHELGHYLRWNFHPRERYKPYTEFEKLRRLCSDLESILYGNKNAIGSRNSIELEPYVGEFFAELGELVVLDSELVDEFPEFLRTENAYDKTKEAQQYFGNLSSSRISSVFGRFWGDLVSTIDLSGQVVNQCEFEKQKEGITHLVNMLDRHSHYLNLILSWDSEALSKLEQGVIKVKEGLSNPEKITDFEIGQSPESLVQSAFYMARSKSLEVALQHYSTLAYSQADFIIGKNHQRLLENWTLVYQHSFTSVDMIYFQPALKEIVEIKKKIK